MLCGVTGGCQLFKSPSSELQLASSMKLEAVCSSEIFFFSQCHHMLLGTFVVSLLVVAIV